MPRSAEQVLASFSGNLTRSDFLVPTGLVGRDGETSQRRFEVYRNNVLSSLSAALAANFPAIQRLLGEEYFKALAVEFVRQSPPTQPVLSEYGADLPEFVRSFPPLADYPYLGDVASLEWVWLKAYHGAELAVTAAEQLQEVTGERLNEVRFKVHPTASSVISQFPIYEIFKVNRDGAAATPVAGGGQGVLVVRPGMHVVVEQVSPETLFLFEQLKQGVSLGAAAEAGLSQFPGFDLGSCLSSLLQTGALAQVLMADT
ncbi:DNA-binding domain-containing protein [Pseudovibrio sp. SPO723]|uniref:DNA-binding domain-containing protein n=1 Tax=Nesiotobacter zosterae TaxID=392721 RepID=UPI0029C47E3E|nr:DNA-binding domain-containing protein [Pseudovibrio sp. SPO723]MDX5594706.1 DNA-binding domain-containing protein [Pseudovibrio sp. SPO723]